ncbi:ion channel [Aliigemmobacter aestuarii]|nr:ion channel [Gemmobacter aestuarii]
MREPHRLKVVLVVVFVSLCVLAVVTIGVWTWAIVLDLLGIFSTHEEAVYFALVSFTTLGFGDVLLPVEWRILGAMAAANGLLTFGLMTAFLVEALRHVRLGQFESRRKSG